MDLQLKGKKVFISGSTAGIGFGVARSFAKEGGAASKDAGTKGTML